MSPTQEPAAMDAYWMPFTPNAAYKRAPRMLVAAQGMHYTDSDGRQLLDGTGGLWCVNLGHGRREIADAVAAQLRDFDFGHSFNLGHPQAFDYAQAVVSDMPAGIEHVFFTNSGSEAIDTAMKMALAWHRVRGQGTRRQFISRRMAYHGVNIGGTSLAGIPNNRRAFGSLLPGVHHARDTRMTAEAPFSRGQPEAGLDRAEDIEALIQLHGPDNVAAVFIEPVAGAGGVFPPPQGYLRRVREICDAHGVLLVFDEVITAFGRLGHMSASERFGVTPDFITSAKGLTNGAIPMGAVFAHARIYQELVRGDAQAPEFFHGYTYSGHPVACAAAHAALRLYHDEGIFERVRGLEAHWQDTLHSLEDCPGVIDVRALGLIAGIEFEARDSGPALAAQVYAKCFDAGVLVRPAGNTVALSPPLIISAEQIDQIADAIRAAAQ